MFLDGRVKPSTKISKTLSFINSKSKTRPLRTQIQNGTLKKLLKDWGGKLTDFSEEEADELNKLKGTLKAEMNKKA